MRCSKCGRELRRGEVFCLNCAEPTESAIRDQPKAKPKEAPKKPAPAPKRRPPAPAPKEPPKEVVPPEKPSEVISCLVIGLFFFFGIPALLFGIYLVVVGVGAIQHPQPNANGPVDLILAVIPLGVFVTLAWFLFGIWRGSRQ